MLRLKHYLKPYILMILIAMVLLFGQGICDLFLPNLMSDIVNVGIQQYGIEHSAVEVISEDGFRMIRSFTSEENAKVLDQSYTLCSPGAEGYARLQERYSLADGNNSLYMLNEDADREALDEIFSRSALAVMLTAQELSNGGSGQQTTELTADGIDIRQIYQLTAMPFFQKSAQGGMQKAALADSTVSNQIGTVMARMFYSESGADLNGMQSAYIFRVGMYMIGVTLMGVAASILVSLIASRVSAGAARKMRADMFRKIEGFSNAEFDSFSTASLITRTTNDITQMQNIVNMGIRMICYAPIMGIGGAILAASTTLSMSWIIVSAIVVLLSVMLIVFKIAMPKFKLMQKMIDRLNLVTRESLSGVLVIRAFGTERYEEERFDKANQDLTSVNLFVNRVVTFLMPIMMLIMNSVSMLVVWVGAHRIEQAQMQVGDMMAFIQYAMMIIMSFLMIAMMFIIIPRASVSADRIADVLESEYTIVDPEEPEAFENVKGEVRFENVSFRYHGAEANALTDISFTAVPGQTTAIIGTTGAGKTTLINLIPRFYDVTEGRITIDGKDIRQLRQRDLRENIGLVPQKGILFSGTIASNLRFGHEEASQKELETSAEIAQATEFIQSKGEGFEAPIAQGGTNVSGGQKQRLAIARALVKAAPIYIFDDSFSALDFKTDAALRKALKQYTGQAAVIIVAQRISTIMHAENILVLDGGRVVGQGTHNELLRSCPVYQEIAVSQNTAMKV